MVIVAEVSFLQMPPVRKPRNRKAAEGVRRATAAVQGREVDLSQATTPLDEMKNLLNTFKKDIMGEVRAEIQACKAVPSELPDQTSNLHYVQPPINLQPQESGIEITGNGENHNRKTQSTLYVPVDTHIKPQLRAKIINDYAVDFAKLIPREVTKKKKVKKAESEEEIDFEELSEKRWIQAWNIFITIYGKAHPERLPRLTSHFQQVLVLMEAKVDWQAYDQETRLLIQDGQIEWGVCLQSLVSKAQLKGRNSNHNKFKTEPGVPWGYCREFHRNNQCSFRASCKFSHDCFKCGSGRQHAAKFCRGQMFGNNGRQKQLNHEQIPRQGTNSSKSN